MLGYFLLKFRASYFGSFDLFQVISQGVEFLGYVIILIFSTFEMELARGVLNPVSLISKLHVQVGVTDSENEALSLSSIPVSILSSLTVLESNVLDKSVSCLSAGVPDESLRCLDAFQLGVSYETMTCLDVLGSGATDVPLCGSDVSDRRVSCLDMVGLSVSDERVSCLSTGVSEDSVSCLSVCWSDVSCASVTCPDDMCGSDISDKRVSCPDMVSGSDESVSCLSLLESQSYSDIFCSSRELSCMPELVVGISNGTYWAVVFLYVIFAIIIPSGLYILIAYAGIMVRSFFHEHSCICSTSLIE